MTSKVENLAERRRQKQADRPDDRSPPENAKGLSPAVITRRHIARNAILPVVTLAGLQAGQLVGGAVLTETVFAWPGIGRLMFDALVQRVGLPRLKTTSRAPLRLRDGRSAG